MGSYEAWVTVGFGGSSKLSTEDELIANAPTMKEGQVA